MLRILTEEDGFQIDLRDLQRLRARHRLLLRETGHSWNKRQSTNAAGGLQRPPAWNPGGRRPLRLGVLLLRFPRRRRDPNLPLRLRVCWGDPAFSAMQRVVTQLYRLLSSRRPSAF